jgi:hypothetical protein
MHQKQKSDLIDGTVSPPGLFNASDVTERAPGIQRAIAPMHQHARHPDVRSGAGWTEHARSVFVCQSAKVASSGTGSGASRYVRRLASADSPAPPDGPIIEITVDFS